MCDGDCEKLKAHLAHVHKRYKEDVAGPWVGFQLEFWGRAPTAEWFAAMDAIFK